GLVDRATFLDTLRVHPAAVTIVTAPGPRGATVSAFMPLCAERPSIVVSLSTATLAHLAQLADGRFGVSLLSADQQHLSNAFANRQSLTEAEKFALSDWSDWQGVPLLASATTVVGCQVVEIHRFADHHLVIGEVVEARTAETPALIYSNQRYGEFSGS
ncbi:flavin reductase family protein, partial [Gammaproteobacteria bacterium]|nr:flavin reductase family protein [Gammaproteobacteria bacterium]